MDESEDFHVTSLTYLDYLHFFHGVITFLNNSEDFDLENYLITLAPKNTQIVFKQHAKKIKSELLEYYNTNNLSLTKDKFDKNEFNSI